MSATEFGERDDSIVFFHQNFHQGITKHEAEEAWQRLTEANTGDPKVEPIVANAEIVSIEALNALPDRAEAA